MTSTEIVITIVVGFVAVAVAVTPILLMLRFEHRDLHGGSRWWVRRHGRRPQSLLDYPRVFNQTTEEEQQELV